MVSHTNVRKFQCSYCGQKFKQKVHMDKHINYLHKVSQASMIVFTVDVIQFALLIVSHTSMESIKKVGAI